jgi:t-SNARE complex subunit (syntaxin)
MVGGKDRPDEHRRCMTMQKRTGYGRTSWKKWLAIYAIAGAIVYVIVYVVFFAHSGGGVGPY